MVLTLNAGSLSSLTTEAEWLEQTSQLHDHDLELMSLNPGRVKLGSVSY